jgi:hypothetical protein
MQFWPSSFTKCSILAPQVSNANFGPPGLPPFAFCGPLGNFDQNFAYVDFFYMCRNVIGQPKKLIFHF